MDILYLLIPLSVVSVFLIGVAFWWSVKSGQFDDLEGPAHRILMDDDEAPRKARPTAVEEGDRPPDRRCAPAKKPPRESSQR